MFNKNEFKTIVNQKYPFLQDLDFSNVILAGGFVRSILLKQSMKDFDFFFYGLDDYNSRFHKLLTDLINNVRNKKMLDMNPDLVIAFHDDIENSKGTKDCIKEAEKRG